MIKKLFNALALSSLIFGAVDVSYGDVLNFEGLTTASAEGITVNNAGYGGFTWDPGWFLYNDTVYPTPAHSGNYAVVSNYGVYDMVVSRTSSFNFDGVWLSGWSTSAPSQIRVQGHDQFNNLVGDTGLQPVTVGVSSFIAANFSNVYRIDFIGGGVYTLDDFTFSQSAAVPEPSSFALLGLGGIGLAFGAYRRRRANAAV